MIKQVLAVSGGVDSMVMLDMVCRSGNYSSGDIIVAHFNHGIRDNAAEDAEFVQKKAREYGLECRVGRAKLGKHASEDGARKARYEFLSKVAGERGGAQIWTAHHLDDLVESVAINLIRGTGWRGLAVLNSLGIVRPFLETATLYEPMDKQAIMEYAAKRRLEFREDQTNSSDEYLRNRLRHQMDDSPLTFEQKLEIYQLWQRQKQLRQEIDRLVGELLPEDKIWQRTWFRNLEPNLALEMLRAGTSRTGIAATRPQLEDFRQAILTYAPGKYFNLPGDKLVKLWKKDFEL